MKKSKKFLQVCSALALSGILLTACAPDVSDSSDSGANTKNAMVWSVANTEKILADVEYDEIQTSKKTVTLSAAKNEYETCQFIITPGEAVKEYTVEISDLAKGSQVIGKENVDVFVQKYVTIQSSTSVYYPKGDYPDGLVPFDSICEYGENSIEKGRNQGITLDVYVPKTADAGIYTGEVTVTLDGSVIKLPVSLEVYNFTVPDATNAKTAFGIYDYMLQIHESVTDRASQDAMVKVYYDYLLDYKINGQMIPYAYSETKTDDEYIEKMAETLAEARRDPRIHFTSLQILTDGDGNINTVFLSRLLAKIAEKSTNENNIFEICYFYAADEPQMNNQIGYLAQRGTILQELKKELVKELDREGVFDDKDSVRQALLDLPVLSTVPLGYGLEGIVDCYVPLFTEYNSVSNRYEQGVREAEGDAFWWYGCVGPTSPYPSYHIDDSLVSARTQSYMQMYYNVQGNLYWATNVYKKYSKSAGGYVDLTEEELWNEAMLFPGANGDGRLLYPGDRYGIDGPLPTVRLLAIRDANEDYDYMYMLKEHIDGMNSAFGTNVTIQELLYKQFGELFRDVKPVIDSDLFAEKREYFARLLEVFEEVPHLIETQSVNAVTGKAVVNVYVTDEEVNLTVNGGCIAGNAVDGGKKFTFETDMAKENVVLEFEKAGKRTICSYDLYGAVFSIAGFEDGEISGVSVSKYGAESDMGVSVNEDVNYVTEGTKSLKVTMKPVLDELSISYVQRCSIELTGILAEKVSSAKELCFTLFNPMEQALKINIRLKDKNGNSAPLGYVMAAPASSETYRVYVTWPSQFNVEEIVGLEFYSDKNSGERDIIYYLDDIYIIK